MKYVDIDGHEIPNGDAGQHWPIVLLEWGCTFWAIILITLFCGLISALLFHSDASASALLDGTLTVEEVRQAYWTKVETEYSVKPVRETGAEPAQLVVEGERVPVSSGGRYDPNDPYCIPGTEFCTRDVGGGHP